MSILDTPSTEWRVVHYRLDVDRTLFEVPFLALVGDNEPFCVGLRNIQQYKSFRVAAKGQSCWL